MKITVRRLAKGFRAQLGDDPSKAATAGSADEAIGALIRQFASDVGIEVVTEDTPSNRSGLSREHYRNRPQTTVDYLRSQGKLDDSK